MDHDHRNDRTPATQCATGIKPAAVSLANAPPAAVHGGVRDPVPRVRRPELGRRDLGRARHPGDESGK
jgi:hypothetical protein